MSNPTIRCWCWSHVNIYQALPLLFIRVGQRNYCVCGKWENLGTRPRVGFKTTTFGYWVSSVDWVQISYSKARQDKCLNRCNVTFVYMYTCIYIHMYMYTYVNMCNATRTCTCISLPLCDYRLKNVTELLLYDNMLESLPASLFHMKSLEMLNIDRNHLAEIPDSVRRKDRDKIRE